MTAQEEKLTAILAIVITSCQLTAPGWGAPANDAFANAAVLSGTLPITVSHSNVGATEEEGEPLLRSSLKTVWWNWTPATSGWTKVFTRGEAETDTVLAIFTNTALNALEVIASNDDAPNLVSSEIAFYAESGHTYRIQVGGYDGEEGPFDLTVAASAPLPLVTSFSVNPLTVDVTDQAQTVSLEVGVAYPPGFSCGTIYLLLPDGLAGLGRPGGIAAYKNIDEANRISGDSASGVYLVFLTIPRFYPPAVYDFSIELIGIDDASMEFGGPEGDLPLPLAITMRTLGVFNNGAVGPYAAWLLNFPSLQGANALRDADPDHDGYPNLFELAFGLDPTKPSFQGGSDPGLANAPVLFLTPTTLGYRYKVGTNLNVTGFGGIRVDAEQSTDLVLWASSGITRSITGGGIQSAYIDRAPNPRRFMRFKITDPAAP